MLSKLNKSYLSVHSVLLFYYYLFNFVMEHYLKPDRLDHDRSDSDSTDKWRHWRKMFEGFLTVPQLSSNTTLTSTKKITFLLHHVSTPIY